MSKKFYLTATTLFGLEEILAAELKKLGAERVQLKRRLVSFYGDKKLLYKTNLYCRTAIRILKPIRRFAVHSEKDLYNGMRTVQWGQYLDATNTLAVDALVHNSKLTHSLYVAQLAKDAIVDQFRKRTGKRPSVNLRQPDIRISLFMNNNKVDLAIDSSGDSLHKRGYRIATTTTPLNEVLAAGIIKLSDWDCQSPFIDPMCGSATFAIEAALMAMKRMPGYYRKQFGFMGWRDFDQELYQTVRSEAEQQEIDSKVSILGSDVNKKASRKAMNNVKNANLSHAIRIQHKAFEAQMPFPVPGILVMNPPYDERQAAENLHAKYKMIGDVLKEKYAGYNAYILTGNREAAKHIGLRPSKRIEIYNGSLECRLLKFEMYKGSLKNKH